jgi:hypothetical protein
MSMRLPASLWRRLVLLCLGLLLHGLVAPVLAQEGRLRVWLLLSEPGGAYAELSRSVQAGLGRNVDLQTLVYAGQEESWSQPMRPGDLVVPLGLKASRAAAQLDPAISVLATLLPRQAYESLLASGIPPRRLFSALVLDQPLERQLGLIRLALPRAERVGVLLGPNTLAQKAELVRAGQQAGLELGIEAVTSQGELFAGQRELLRDNEVLLALPDPLVLNQTTLMSYLVGAYRARVPVIGFSQSFTEAGALASVFSTPEQIGRQLSEIVSGIANGRAGRPARLIYPRYFKVYVNRQVARSLELDIAPDDRLQKQLEVKEGQAL